jgi:ribosome biogenesis GTPase
VTGHDLDEDDVRVRPSRRGSRPRTKDRPTHEDAVPGVVVTVDRGRYTCRLLEPTRPRGSARRPGRAAGHAPGDGPDGTVVAMRARELRRGSIVPGDRVALVGEVGGGTDHLARIVRVEPRRSVLRRSADDTDLTERAIVANADQMAVVVAVTDPTPRPRLIDRCMVAALDAGIAPLLIVTKADLGDPEPLAEAYRALDVPVLVIGSDDPAVRAAAVERVRAALAGHTTVLVGHSGVGKSTLVNALVPGADRATGAVNDVTGRGRHTSSSAIALALPRAAETDAGEVTGEPDRHPRGRHAPEGHDDGWIIDTPGVRSFGLAHVDPARVVEAFADLRDGTAECPRACSHDEPDCGLDAWVAAGHASAARLDSMRRLLTALRAGEDERAEG